MAISLVGVSALGAAAAASVTPGSMPTTQTGDMILAFGLDREDSPAPTFSCSGYTNIFNRALWDMGTAGVSSTLWYKFASGVESAPTITNTQGTTVGIYGVAAVLRGVDTSSPFRSTNPNGGSAGNEITTLAMHLGGGPNLAEVNDAWVMHFTSQGDNNTLSLTTAGSYTADAIGASYLSATGLDGAIAVLHAGPFASGVGPTEGTISSTGAAAWSWGWVWIHPSTGAAAAPPEPPIIHSTAVSRAATR